MTAYRKSMKESLAEVRNLQEDNMDLMRKAAGKGGMQTIKMKDGKLKMDKVTASAIMQIFDKLNPANQKKMEQMINGGKKSGIIKLSDFAMSKVTGFKSEETELDEKEVWDKPMPEDEKEGKLTSAQKAKAKARAKAAGRKYPNMIDNMWASNEEFELDEAREKTVRQLIDPKREVMVVKKNKVVVIDKKDQDKYVNQGWELAEETELDEAVKEYDVKIKVGSKTNSYNIMSKDELSAAQSVLHSVMARSLTGGSPGLDAVRKQFPDMKSLKKKGVSVSIKEETELDEAPKYELYHKDFSTAMQHAYKMAKKLHGITVKSSEIDDKVASGPRKPSEGKTNSYRLEGDRGAIQVQVYNKGGSKPYELNFYKEEVEFDRLPDMRDALLQVRTEKPIQLDEAKVLAKKGNMQVINDDGVIKLMKGNKVVSSGDYDRGAGGFFMGKKQQFFDKAEDILKMKEEVEIDEGMTLVLKNRSAGVAQSGKEAGKTMAATEKRFTQQKRTADAERNFQRQMSQGKSKLDKKKGKTAAQALEQFELEEGRMKELHMYIQQGKSAKEIAKLMKLDVKTIKALMPEAYEVGTDEYREYLERLTPGEMYYLPSENDPNNPRTYDPNQPVDIDGAKPYVKQKPDGTWCVYDSKGNIVSEHESEDEAKSALSSMKEEVELGEQKFDVKTAETKKGKITVNSFANLEAAKKYLEYMQKRGHKGIISQGGRTIKEETEINEISPILAALLIDREAIDKKIKKAIKGEEEVESEIDEASARADAKRAMRSDPSMKQNPFLTDVEASDEDIKGASKNIIMQMRKSVSLRGTHPVEFLDKKKVKIPVKIAQAVQDKYNSFRKPADKEKFQARVAKSHRDMLLALKENVEVKSFRDSVLDRVDEKIENQKELDEIARFMARPLMPYAAAAGTATGAAIKKGIQSLFDKTKEKVLSKADKLAMARMKKKPEVAKKMGIKIDNNKMTVVDPSKMPTKQQVKAGFKQSTKDKAKGAAGAIGAELGTDAVIDKGKDFGRSIKSGKKKDRKISFTTPGLTRSGKI